MNKHLKFSVTFTKPARTISFEHTWLPGLTAITGANGSGKSLITEMSQYAKFGTPALRSTGEDYKSIHVEETFELKGKEYRVIRSKTETKLFENGLPVATGTKPVNAAILQALGYSYAVFQVANACNQDKINQLGEMLPTARKKLIDETVGLAALDGLTKFIAESEKSLRDQAKGMESALVKPVEVVKPEGYVESEILKTSIRTLQLVQTERNVLKSKADVVVQMPVFDKVCEDLDQLPVYLQQVKDHQNVASQLALLMQQYQKLPAIPAKGPSLLLSDIEEQEELIRKYNDWNTQNNLRTRLEGAKVRHECPSCNHEWFDQDTRLEEMKDLPREMAKPLYNATQLSVARTEITSWEYAQLKAKEKQELSEQWSALNEQHKLMPLPSDSIIRIEQFKTAKARYEVQLEAAVSQQQAKDLAAEALKDSKYEGIDGKIECLSAQLTTSIVYETQAKAYDSAKTLYYQALERVLKLEADADEWGRAKKAVTDLRARVKGFLLPSLNKVASSLINAMTGGELSWIVINDEFEITVEGQNLQTLSGAGKSVANLAIRIALGQVLTNSVFSSLSLDEIDASCDANRSNYIAQCLKRLTGQIKQIIQISHKQIEADNYVRL